MIQSTRQKPVHLIVNPHSGYGGHQQLRSTLLKEVRSSGHEVVEYVTKAPQDATRYARQIAEEASGVIVWGGDGTVSEVAAGLAGSDVPILPCPAGTENLLAKEMNVPSQPHAVAELLNTGQVVQCDLGRINGENFLLIIGIGFDGEVVRRVHNVRTGHISHLSYFWPIWRTFWGHDFPRMKIIADGEIVFDDIGLAFVGNISRYAVGLRICRDAAFDDGLLDLVVFSCREQTSLVLHAAWTLLKMHPSQDSVLYRKFRHAEIITETAVASQVDGDPGPDTPLDISVCPRQIQLIIPPQSARRGWPWKHTLERSAH
ncbi:MAG: diacylglycerol/lipid kinase family protein [Phycisphaerae bacterium]